MRDIAESAARCVIRHRPAATVPAKNPSNRGRTSDLGIAQCFPLQSHALPTELSKAYYLLPKVLYNEQLNKSRLSIQSRGPVLSKHISGAFFRGLLLRVEYPVRGADD
jgi:hypothetical protein